MYFYNLLRHLDIPHWNMVMLRNNIHPLDTRNFNKYRVK